MSLNKNKPITFQLHAPQAHSVFMAGTFNDWDGTNLPMERNQNETWEQTINLEPGVYEYRFIVDGDWSDDPACEERILSPLGTYNCLIRVE